MARTPAPPGPPPPHYRPPNAPPPAVSSGPLTGVRRTPAGPNPSDGVTAGAVVAVAAVALLIGGVIGFFIGRAAESGGDPRSLTPLTSPSTPTSRPPGDTVPQGSGGGPPATDLAPAEIGTLGSPVPIGQAYVLGLFEIEVLGADRDAGPELAAHSALNTPAPEGRRHVLVEIAVRFTDRGGLGNPASIPFFLTDGAAEWRDVEATCGAVPDPLIDAGLLEQGDEAVGNACFTVAADAVDALVLGTEGFAGPLYFALPG